MAHASERLLHVMGVLHQPLYIHPDPHHVLSAQEVDPQALLCSLATITSTNGNRTEEKAGYLFPKMQSLPQDYRL